MILGVAYCVNVLRVLWKIGSIDFVVRSRQGRFLVPIDHPWVQRGRVLTPGLSRRYDGPGPKRARPICTASLAKEGKAMLQFVHHVQYYVRNRDEFVAYMEKNFGLKPTGVEDRNDHSKHALYKIGQTEIQVAEPAPGTGGAKFLAEHGPGVGHVAWSIPNARQLARQLKAKGNTLRGEEGFTTSTNGYSAINIDPKDSMGIHFQLIEDHR